MRAITIFPMSDAPAVGFAARELEKQGVAIADFLSPAVTHVLLSVPTKETVLPQGVTVIGGNLEEGYPKIDLLKDEQYLAENAAITADCALRLLSDRLPVTFCGCPMLVIGWGRIGKCLASMLKALGAEVTVAARKPADLGMLTALGYKTAEIGKCLASMLKALGAEVTVAARKPADLGMLTALGYKTAEIGNLDPVPYRAIVNTAPAPVLSAGGNAIKIDLASRLGMAGEDVIWARGLPGKMLPEASGALIARCVLRHLREGTV